MVGLGWVWCWPCLERSRGVGVHSWREIPGNIRRWEWGFVTKASLFTLH